MTRRNPIFRLLLELAILTIFVTSTVVQSAFIPIQKLIGAGRIGASRMGAAVAINLDGTTALVGGWHDAVYAGAVWTFDRLENGTWVQQNEKLTVPDAHYFGWSIALSADGKKALIGSPQEDSQIGSARLFSRLANGTWVQQGDRFQGTDYEGVPQIGSAVAMDRNATRAFVGGPMDGSGKGAVWVLESDGQGDWAQVDLKLIPSDGTGSQSKFGSSLAVSDDARILLIGGPADDNDKGAIWTFLRHDNGTYFQSQPKLVPGDLTDAGQFGTRITLSADGSTALIGAPSDSAYYGGVWVYTRLLNGTFVQLTEKLHPTGVVGSDYIYIGSAIALTADGYTAVVGGFGDNLDQGALWVFCRNENNSWIQVGSKFRGPDAVFEAQQGSALALSADGSTLISGGQNDDIAIGAAWIFNTTSLACPGASTVPPPASQPPTPSSSAAKQGDDRSASVVASLVALMVLILGLT